MSTQNDPSITAANKPQRQFGDGSLDIVQLPDGQIEIAGGLHGLAFSHGCPIPDTVAAKFSPEWATNRYASCNVMFKHVILPEALAKPEQTLARALTSPLPRLLGEEPRNFDPERVPANYMQEFQGMCSPWGYAAPRIIFEQLGNFSNRAEQDLHDPHRVRFDKAMGVLREAVAKTDDPLTFIVLLAEGVSKADADPTAVLSHLLSADFYRDENAPSIVATLHERLEAFAPTLWSHLQTLSDQAKDAAGICRAPEKIDRDNLAQRLAPLLHKLPGLAFDAFRQLELSCKRDPDGAIVLGVAAYHPTERVSIFDLRLAASGRNLIVRGERKGDLSDTVRSEIGAIFEDANQLIADRSVELKFVWVAPATEFPSPSDLQLRDTPLSVDEIKLQTERNKDLRLRATLLHLLEQGKSESVLDVKHIEVARKGEKPHFPNGVTKSETKTYLANNHYVLANDASEYSGTVRVCEYQPRVGRISEPRYYNMALINDLSRQYGEVFEISLGALTALEYKSGEYERLELELSQKSQRDLSDEFFSMRDSIEDALPPRQAQAPLNVMFGKVFSSRPDAERITFATARLAVLNSPNIERVLGYDKALRFYAIQVVLAKECESRFKPGKLYEKPEKPTSNVDLRNALTALFAELGSSFEPRGIKAKLKAYFQPRESFAELINPFPNELSLYAKAYIAAVLGRDSP